jgi:transposase-like protein
MQFASELVPTEVLGRVIVLPIVSPQAFFARQEYTVPEDGKNLNRQFPGDPAGTVSQRMAFALGGVPTMLFSEHSSGRLEVRLCQSPAGHVHAVMEITVACRQIRCPACQRTDVMTHGITAPGTPRYRWKPPHCSSHPWLVEYSHQGRVPAVKQSMLELTWHGSGMRDMARVLHISPTPVIEALTNSASDSPHQRSGNPA